MKKLITFLVLLSTAITYCQESYILKKNGDKIEIKIDRFITRTIDEFRYTPVNKKDGKKIDLTEVEKVVHGNAIYRPIMLNLKKTHEWQLFKVIATQGNKTLLVSFNPSGTTYTKENQGVDFISNLVIVYFCVIDENFNLLETGNVTRAAGKKSLAGLEARTAATIKKHFGTCNDLVESLNMDFAIDAKKDESTPETNFFMQDKVFECN